MAGEIHPKATSHCYHHSTALNPFWSIWELPEVFAPWRIQEHRQVAPLWRDEDETPNPLLPSLKPCRLLEDFLEDVSLMDRAGELALPKKVAINSLPPLNSLSRRSQEFFLTG